MKKFKLSETQAEAILETKLRQLAKLEEEKIHAEQKELDTERNALEKTLASKAKLKTLVRHELSVDKETFGDARCSPIVERPEAQAMSEEALITAEPVTIILSQQGWIRSGKGHDVKGEELNYKSGDGFLAQVQGRSNEWVVFLDSTGKSYSLLAHTLPSARGLGEPLTSRLKPTPGSTFVGLLMGEPNQLCLLASDAGYGFLTPLNNLYVKARSGKAMLKPPKGSHALMPHGVTDKASQFIAAVTSEGHLLVFPISELPELPRGKGNKMISIPPARVASREEYCVAIAVLNESSALTVYSGKRPLTLKPQDLANYQGERGRRGNKLPRAFRRIDRVSHSP